MDAVIRYSIGLRLDDVVYDEEFEKQFFESSELNLKKLQQQEEFEKFELEGDEPKYLN